ncbi:MAG: sigma factor-like helix-turn-helix DNA-binding protein [Chloroflexota bacterium]
MLLQNISRQYMNRQINPKSVETAVELDARDDWLNNILDPQGETEQQQFILRQDLNRALMQLSSDARRQFIQLYYFEHLTFPEIARRLDRKENALYKLHHDALKNLRKIFHENGHTYG